MIVFGHNNFLIKSFKPEEAGLPPVERNAITFEVRQRYFHLFWIPFFPIGKVWGLKRAGDENLYAIPDDIEQVVKSNVSVGTPWYSFALCLIALFVGAVIFLKDVQRKQGYEDNFYNRIAESKMLIDYPTTGDFYKFSYYEEGSESSYGKDLLLKVKQYDDDKIQFNTLNKEMYKESSAYSGNFKNIYLGIESNDYNPFYIDKEVLKSLFNEEYRSYSGEPKEIPGLSGKFILKKVERMELKK